MTHATPTPTPSLPDAPVFDPAAPRPRHDGWSGERQVGFVEALAECGCVEEACARVGMSVSSAYALRRRPDAQSFRRAWAAALDQAVERLSDAVFARAVNGVARPVFYQGRQVGERRHYDERLAMFVLRYRDPARYGAWLDRCEARRHPEGPALALGLELNRVAWDAAREEAGLPPRVRPSAGPRFVDAAERAEAEARAAADRDEAADRAETERSRREYERALADCCRPEDDEADDDLPEPAAPGAAGGIRGDVPSTSSTSDGDDEAWGEDVWEDVWAEDPAPGPAPGPA